MTDEQHELRRVNWHEIFGFTHIFKSFRMAIHPTKLALAVAAILVVYVGGTILGAVWSLCGQRVRDQEINSHFTTSPAIFAESQKKWEESLPDSAASLLADATRQAKDPTAFKAKWLTISVSGGNLATAFKSRLNKETTTFERVDVSRLKDESNNDPARMTRQAAKKFKEEVELVTALMDGARDDAIETVKNSTTMSDEKRKEARKQIDLDYSAAVRALTDRKLDFEKARRQVAGTWIFSAWLEYEGFCLGESVKAVRHGSIFGGLSGYMAQLRAKSAPSAAMAAEPAAPPQAAMEEQGFVYWTLAGAGGVCWMIGEHWLFATLFLVLTLASWALFGGAIHRVAALHAARDEKISITQALRFSAQKFFSFFTAPLIPIGAIVVVGGATAFMAFVLGNWPYVGEILLGMFFFLALFLGLVASFMLVGLGAGWGMMYPTIAVEGSDSFDAMSRSFSYVFARPWRAGLYSLVALFYGVICYLFVRLFAFIALSCAHAFVKWGVFTGGQTLGDTADKIDVLWSAPSFDTLLSPVNWAAMDTWTLKVGGALMWFWVFLIACTVLGFLLTYFASSTTIMYYLLRRKVDATDLDDVYVEEPEEFVPPTAEPAKAEPAKAEPAADEAPKAETPKPDETPTVPNEPPADKPQA